MSNYCIGSIDQSIVNEEKKRITEWAEDETNPWISVSDKLPKESEIVLGKVNIKNRVGIFHEIILIDGTWYSGNLGLMMEGCICDKVTHWKPMKNEENN